MLNGIHMNPTQPIYSFYMSLQAWNNSNKIFGVWNLKEHYKGSSTASEYSKKAKIANPIGKSAYWQ